MMLSSNERESGDSESSNLNNNHHPSSPLPDDYVEQQQEHNTIIDQEQLDEFLYFIESKLRSNFSSLDLTKSINNNYTNESSGGCHPGGSNAKMSGPVRMGGGSAPYSTTTITRSGNNGGTNTASSLSSSSRGGRNRTTTGLMPLYNNNNNLTSFRYMELLRHVFGNISSIPVKLRVLIALLGLDPDAASSYIGSSSSSSSSSNNNSSGIRTESNDGTIGDDGGSMVEENSDRSSNNQNRANQKFHMSLCRLLNMAQKDKEEDEWVRAIAGIVRKKMFRHNLKDNIQSDHDHGMTNENKNPFLEETLTAIQKDIACSINESKDILEEVKMYDLHQHNHYCKKKLEHPSNRNEQQQQQQRQQQPKEFIFQQIQSSWMVQQDVRPLYAPYRYSLIDTNLLQIVMPELDMIGKSTTDDDDETIPTTTTTPMMEMTSSQQQQQQQRNHQNQPHFLVNTNARILLEDDHMERLKAQEEERELESKKRMREAAEEKKLLLLSNANGGPYRDTVRGGHQHRNTMNTRGGDREKGRGPFDNNNNNTNRMMTGIKRRIGSGTTTTSRDAKNNNPNTSQLLVRSKGKDSTTTAAATTINSSSSSNSARLVGRGGHLGGGGRGKLATLGRGRGGRMTGLGRGAAANALGGKSLANPSSMRKGVTRSLLLSSRRPGVSTNEISGGATMSASRSSSKQVSENKSKMKVIDVNEVKGLAIKHQKREDTLIAESKKKDRKRKIMEAAAKSGLKSTKKWGVKSQGKEGTGEGGEVDAEVDNTNGNDVEDESRVGQLRNQSNKVDSLNLSTLENENNSNRGTTESHVQHNHAEKNPFVSDSEIQGAGDKTASLNNITTQIQNNTLVESKTHASDHGQTNFGVDPSYSLDPIASQALSLYQDEVGIPSHQNLIQVNPQQQILQHQNYMQVQQQEQGQQSNVQMGLHNNIQYNNNGQNVSLAQQQMHSQQPTQFPNTNSLETQPIPPSQTVLSHLESPSMALEDRQEEWVQLLQKSNKISDEDKLRVRNFFVDRYNPDPNVMVYRMKLHEEKSLDHVTGQVVKETLYLELDYNTFGYKKLKKIKKK